VRAVLSEAGKGGGPRSEFERSSLQPRPVFT
jgi:hypothetical protein